MLLSCHTSDGDGLMLKAYVRKLDFFPFLRFCQMFSREIKVPFKPKTITVLFEPIGQGEKDILHKTRFSAIKQLIWLHWIHDMPLWRCLASRRDDDTAYCCLRPLEEFLTSARQIVALFHIDIVEWKSLSIFHLHLYSLMQDDGSTKPNWAEDSDAKLVEAIIESLGTAIEYRLGYQGNFSWNHCNHVTSHDMFGWFTGAEADGKIAREKEHAVIHVTNQYFGKVDEALRQRLGDEYEAWDKFSGEEERIRDDVIL